MAGWGPEIPRRFVKNLIPSEHLVLAVRRHPAQLLEPVLSTVAGLVAVLWLQSEISRDVPYVPTFLWLLWLLVLLRALWHLYEWSQDWFVVTDQRIMLSYGVLVRRLAMMPMPKVTDMSYNRTPMGRVFGYGEFVLESAGQEQALHVVSWLPNPDNLYQLICTELFGSDDRYPEEPPPPPEPVAPRAQAWRGFRLGPSGRAAKDADEARRRTDPDAPSRSDRGRRPRYDTDIIDVTTTGGDRTDTPVHGTAWDEATPEETGWANASLDRAGGGGWDDGTATGAPGTHPGAQPPRPSSGRGASPVRSPGSEAWGRRARANAFGRRLRRIGPRRWRREHGED